MLCSSQKSTGVTVNGGYAEYVKAPAAFTHRIPEGLDIMEAAPLLCAGITVFAPLRRAGNLAGKTVAVAGIGGLGHLGIRGNSVHPGGVDTEMVRGAPDASPDLDARWQSQPIARVAEPREIASVVLFLASDDASYCTGAEFVADGGMLAGMPAQRR